MYKLPYGPYNKQISKSLGQSINEARKTNYYAFVLKL